MVVIALFFVGHWTLSVFFQTFFQHRYAAHRMFTMSKGWERFFYLATYVTQGSSFLVPRGYAILHRMHHAYSDTPKDPHSPHQNTNVFTMMYVTKGIYHGFAHRQVEPEKRFDGGMPEWPFMDKLGRSWIGRFAWVGVYTGVYAVFATQWWMFLLLPFHYVMGPVHGAIVNWCGHKYGYSNFENGDKSKNTLIFDFVTLGELFQNNHHKFGMSPNFAARWFEVDPTYQVMKLMNLIGIIDMGKKPQLARFPAQAPANEVAADEVEGREAA
jgi:stearoyl-CoA desaturase (Delta-9 desaturase)